MPHDITKLTVKENRFCIELVNNGDKYEAYKKAGFDAKTKGAKAASVSRLLKKPRITAVIEQLQDEIYRAGSVTEVRIIANLAEIAFEKTNSKPDRTRALELLGKSKAMFTDRLIEADEKAPVLSPEEQAQVRAAFIKLVPGGRKDIA